MKCNFSLNDDFLALEPAIRHTVPGCSEVFIVYDSAVEALADDIAGMVGAQASMAIEGGEADKTMDTVLDICRFLSAMQADRNAFVLGIGGGVTTDMVGLASSLYKRGISFGFVPTTLLAQVDASIGGKNAVDLDGVRNLLGSFAQPAFTYIVPGVLETLPRKEMLCGLAEMLKTFLIGDNDFYIRALKWAREGMRVGEELSLLIGRAAQIKAGIVDNDFLDRGERRRLNLGHTFAHAIESVSAGRVKEGRMAEPVPHGLAVAIGLVMAARLSEEKGTVPTGTAERLADEFSSCGLPVSLPSCISEADLEEYFLQDKKCEGGNPGFVLL